MSIVVTTKPDADPDFDPSTPKRKRKKARSPKLPYWLTLPAVAALVVGLAYPLGWQVLNSMREYGLRQQFGEDATWLWFANYTDLLTDGFFWTVVIRSLVFMAATALATMGLGILLALLMKATPTWARVMLQSALLLAWAMPIVAQMTVWNWLIDSRNGVLNYLLSKLPGVDMIGHNWLEEPLSFFFVASLIITWASVPFVAISVYAALTQVSEEVLEAAQLDGANARQKLVHIIMPIIRPVLVILLLLQFIWDLRVYAQIQLLQDLGPKGDDYDLLGTYIFGLGIGQGRFGLAAAAAMIVLLITLCVSGFYVRELLREDAR
ncbi:carbohydrate ABC transporter permease [Ilumatobacter nonamiensis]|uniref:carbohydrate ABC transporter permease n=1 Tax=Ilumatobacter nonamiensis TaxID=467093 RepID=UPI000344CA6A|nr:sugar ABC transporter permease [Ilumatobacter nonamiensis]